MHQPVIARDQRRRDRRRLLPVARLRHPHRRRAGVLPRRRHQQRAHRQRARPQLPAAARDRLLARVRDHAHRPRRRRRRGRAHRPGVATWCRDDQLLDACYETRRADHRLEPPGRRAHQAQPVVEPRRRQPAAAHEPGGHRAALRAHDHRQLRGGHQGPQGEAPCRLPRHQVRGRAARERNEW